MCPFDVHAMRLPGCSLGAKKKLSIGAPRSEGNKGRM